MKHKGADKFGNQTFRVVDTPYCPWTSEYTYKKGSNYGQNPLKEAPIIYVDKSKKTKTGNCTTHKLDEYGEDMKYCYLGKVIPKKELTYYTPIELTLRGDAYEYIKKYQNGAIKMSGRHMQMIKKNTTWNTTVLGTDQPLPYGAKMIARLGIVNTRLTEMTRPYTFYAFDIGMAVQVARTLDGVRNEVIPLQIIWMKDQLIFDDPEKEKYWLVREQLEERNIRNAAIRGQRKFQAI